MPAQGLSQSELVRTSVMYLPVPRHSALPHSTGPSPSARPFGSVRRRPSTMPDHKPCRSTNGLSCASALLVLQCQSTPPGYPQCRRRVFRKANLSALPSCTCPFLVIRLCHTARGLPPPHGLLGPFGVVIPR